MKGCRCEIGIGQDNQLPNRATKEVRARTHRSAPQRVINPDGTCQDDGTNRQLLGLKLSDCEVQKVAPARISICDRPERTAESFTPKLRSIHRVNLASASRRTLPNRN